MELRWRQGLSSATGPERMVLLDAERAAREIAFGEAYQERCDAHGSLLVDAHDLAIRSTRIKWARHKRCLWVVVDCYHRSAGRVRSFRWRAPMR